MTTPQTTLCLASDLPPPLFPSPAAQEAEATLSKFQTLYDSASFYNDLMGRRAFFISPVGGAAAACCSSRMLQQPRAA